jgi:hypothetical protein
MSTRDLNRRARRLENKINGRTKDELHVPVPLCDICKKRPNKENNHWLIVHELLIIPEKNLDASEHYFCSFPCLIQWANRTEP